MLETLGLKIFWTSWLVAGLITVLKVGCVKISHRGVSVSLKLRSVQTDISAPEDNEDSNKDATLSTEHPTEAETRKDVHNSK